MGLTPCTPLLLYLPPWPYGENSNQLTSPLRFFFFLFSIFFFQALPTPSELKAGFSEMFLLIPISFIITNFPMSGRLGLAEEGNGNYFGVSGINPARCHWMACLPQWLMNRPLVSRCPPPTAVFSEWSVPLNQFAKQWQVWTTVSSDQPSLLTSLAHLLDMLS